MAKIFTVAYVPDDLAHEWLQHLRDFDAKHPRCHFEVLADVPDMSVTKVMEVVSIKPALDFTVVKRKER